MRANELGVRLVDEVSGESRSGRQQVELCDSRIASGEYERRLVCWLWASECTLAIQHGRDGLDEGDCAWDGAGASSDHRIAAAGRDRVRTDTLGVRHLGCVCGWAHGDGEQKAVDLSRRTSGERYSRLVCGCCEHERFAANQHCRLRISQSHSAGIMHGHFDAHNDGQARTYWL